MQKFLYPRFRSFQCFSSFSVSCFVFLSFSLFFSFFFISWRFIYGDAGPNGEKTVVISKKTSNRTRRFFLFCFLCTVKKTRQSRNHNFPKILKLERLSNNKKSIQNRLLVRFLLMTQKREQQFGSVQAHPSFQTQTNKQTTKDSNFQNFNLAFIWVEAAAAASTSTAVTQLLSLSPFVRSKRIRFLWMSSTESRKQN